ncbi:MAG TPA: ABC transporter substrate-binding protein [Stellaceae bacterium]|nr:ABC transporter substrate-binding protein [Stellaceae bacterium]
MTRARLPFALAAALLLVGAGAHASDRLRVAKSPNYLFAYTPVDVGMAKGMFQKRQLEIEHVSFEGASKMVQGIVAGAVDIALGSPMDMVAMAKGMPAVAIAVIAEPMTEFIIMVPYDSPVRTLDDLKGKTIGIATVGSITEWVALELARVKGWGRDGIHTVGIGAGNASATAAMKTHLVDASVSTQMTGVVLERAHIARRLADVPDYARPFIAHLMSATTALVKENPDAVRRFVAGWFEAVAFMRANKAETIRIARVETGLSEEDETVEYDLLMREVSPDGHFDRDSVDRIGKSFVELGVLEAEPDMAKLYTERFLPKR